MMNVQGTPIGNNMLNDAAELGTPSAPPIMDIGNNMLNDNSEVESELIKDSGGLREIEKSAEEIHVPKGSAQGCLGSEAVIFDARAQDPIHEPGERCDYL